MATEFIDVEDANGDTEQIAKPNENGRAPEADSRPIALSDEDFAAVGATDETAPGSDTAAAGLNGRLQRIAQRLTSLITAIGTRFAPGDVIGNTVFGAVQSGAWSITNISGAVSLPTGAATEASLATRASETTLAARASETTLAAASAKLPASLGAKAGSGSMSVVPATDAAFVLGAGEAHVGQVGGFTVVATAAPTVSTSAYAPGDVIGVKMTFASLARVAGGSGLVQMISIFCKSAQTFACDLILFHTDPSSSTFTDNAALAVNAADFDKVLGVISLVAGSWTNLGTPSFAQAIQLAMAYKLPGGVTDMYGVLVARGTPTLVSTSDIKVAVKGLLD